jgi:hypothetical protein
VHRLVSSREILPWLLSFKPALPSLESLAYLHLCAACVQTVEYLVTRDQDERQYNLDVGTRVLVYVPPDAIMGFNLDEIDSAPRL